MSAPSFFGNLDFLQIADNPEFKEASVRSFIIDPLIKKLGYSEENIVLEKTVQIQTGSNKKKTTPYYADYVLKIGNNFVCVIEAKTPEKNIDENSLIDQAFSYASHRDIRSNYFVLCNGLWFALYKTDLERTQVLHFHLSEIDQYWQELKRYLSPDSFLEGKQIQYEKPPKSSNIFDTLNYCRQKLLDEVPIRRQAVRRHFGVHGYFTRQSWDIVQAYIRNYSQPGDVVLDPFGGSGVTVTESLMLNRKGMHVDINPLANFLVDSLLAPVNIQELEDAFESIKEKYIKNEPKTKIEIKEALKKYPHPKQLPLPKGSDVKTTDKLFSPQQTAQLGLLKFLILKQKNANIRKSLLLMFSGIVTRHNVTFHSNSHRGGNAAAFMYYRYRVAPHPDEIDIPSLLSLRYNAVIKAKREMSQTITNNTISDAQIIKASATNLSFLKNESVDYIYTDPPYGRNIQYLDLSAMWCSWLDLDITEEDYKLEAIEDGKLDKSKDEYKRLIAQSIKEMFRVLKYDRWLSFVFAHKDPDFWHLIIDTAELCGFEYVGAVSQKNGSSNYHKRQHPFTVLSGQLIINFRKVRNPRTLLKANLGIDINEIIIQTVEGLIARKEGATLEQINDEMITKAMELGFLDILAKEYKDITDFLSKHFSYDYEKQVYFIPQGKPFKSHIPVELRFSITSPVY
ncbi:MAG: type I restriction enzyme HsdR N-terminal domain-containing protein [Planctomycetaceae bacterium]|jgi:16S rRNA G966 N2-methylase RsmD|nr:type I restriction enzyme HsdR N-terminal domain-containing protein [Planctomycetaceae bacterium]